jgi:DNA-binding MarR family transcriptional regulator
MIMNTVATEKEIEVLAEIYHDAEHFRQRDLARVLGISLGMTNAIVKRLAQKGWLTIRKVNNRNIRYAVSARGIEQITRRSYQYFKQTIKSIVYFREDIEALAREVSSRGFGGICLIGPSQLDFIVEHACHACGIEFLHEVSRTTADDEARTVREVRGLHGSGKRLFLLFSEASELVVGSLNEGEGVGHLSALHRSAVHDAGPVRSAP